LVVALVLVAIAAGAYRSDTRKLGRNGVIAYSVEDHSGISIGERRHARLMNADGTDDRPLGAGLCPAFSADGNALAYVSTATGSAELVVTSAEGSRPQELPGVAVSTIDPTYALSPDGTKIAWLKADPDGSPVELWVNPVSGAPGVQIPAAPALDESIGSPVWSPDGREIAFAHWMTVDGADTGTIHASIAIVAADGSNRRDLPTSHGTDRTGITWSPDGRSLAYAGRPDSLPLPSASDGSDPALDVFVVDATGTGERNITNSPADESGPAWSPDGAHLAFQTSEDGGIVFATSAVRMNGSVASGPLIAGPASDGFAWSPDGARLLLVQTEVTDTASDPQTVQSTIRTVDAEFRQVPVTALRVDFPIRCIPSWQRIAP
jgi:Tol biopolymer transport system component